MKQTRLEPRQPQTPRPQPYRALFHPHFAMIPAGVLLIGFIIGCSKIEESTPEPRTANAPENATMSFPELEYREIEGRGIEIGVPKEGFTAEFSPSNRSVGSVRASTLRIGSTVVGNDTLTFYYTDGASDDPAVAAIANDKDEVLYADGERFHIMGDTVYVEGHANTEYDQKRMFVFTDGTFKEVPQAFYHIGLSGPLKRSVVLYADQTQTSPVTELPAGTEAEIVLTNFGGSLSPVVGLVLIKSDFGLLGWVQLQAGDIGTIAAESNLMKGFYYAGD